jgi:hypothetical protein
MTTTIVVTIIIAVAGRLMADEVKAWSGWLQKKLRCGAVAKLPAESRERYDEEWQSGVEEIPGEIFKLFYSVGLLWAAFGIRNAALTSMRSQRTSFTSLKRSLDFVFAGMILILIAPTFLVIMVAIKLESPGPIFYRTERIGKKSRIFRCFKFRTMTLETRAPMIDSLEARITPIGRFLRKYSLDELPQIINVLKGEMSLVGRRRSL